MLWYKSSIASVKSQPSTLILKMLIKYQALKGHLKNNIRPVYVISGTSLFLFHDAVSTLKSAWRAKGEVDETKLDIQMQSDWPSLLEKSNHYSLFADLTLIDVRFDKKTLDKGAQKIIEAYLQNINPKCLVLIQAPMVPYKQWQSLSEHQNLVLINILPFTSNEHLNWIKGELNQRLIRTDATVPQLIHHYTEGNLLASANAIEHLALIKDDTTVFSAKDLEDMLIDQCVFQLYELGDACLSGNALKSIQLLRFAHHQRIEPTLVLWLLTQEIRQLMQLTHLIQQSKPFTDACKELKIWPKRMKYYEQSLKRLPQEKLFVLLNQCKHLDERIKTTEDKQIWQSFENLALDMSSTAQFL